MHNNACFIVYIKRQGSCHKATKCFHGLKSIFMGKSTFPCRRGFWNCSSFRKAKISMALFGDKNKKSAKEACYLKRFLQFKLVWNIQGRSTWDNRLHKVGRRWMECVRVTSLVGTCTSWNITVPQSTQDTCYYTNKLLYSRACKKKDLCACEREKPHILGQLPFHHTPVCCDQLPEQKCPFDGG